MKIYAETQRRPGQTGLCWRGRPAPQATYKFDAFAAHRLTPGRWRFFFIHLEHVEDLGDDAIERAMFLAENFTCPVEPDARLFKLSDGWTQRQDRNGDAVVYIAQDVTHVASGGFVVM
jgi:hypothetical protein